MSSSVDQYMAKNFAELDILCQDLMGIYRQDAYKPAHMNQTSSMSNCTSLRPQLSSTTIEHTMQESAMLSSHVSCKLLQAKAVSDNDEHICDTSLLDDDLQQEVEKYFAQAQLMTPEYDIDALIEALSAFELANEKRVVLPYLSQASNKGINKLANRSKAFEKRIHRVPDYSFLRRREHLSEKIPEPVCPTRNQN